MLNTLSIVFNTKIFYINNSYFNNLTDKYPCLGNDKGCGKFKERYLIAYPEHSICFHTNLLWFFPITSNFSNFFRRMKSLFFDKMDLLPLAWGHKISPNKILKSPNNILKRVLIEWRQSGLHLQNLNMKNCLKLEAPLSKICFEFQLDNN